MPDTMPLSEFARKFRSLVDSGKRFLLLTHVRPDGDAYGCLLAMAHSLREMGKEVVAWNQDGVVERYRFLPGAESIQSVLLPTESFDVRIVMDTASVERVGHIGLPLDPKSPVINIDHHASNPRYGDLVYLEPDRASCGEVVYDLLKQAEMPISARTAECLFVAISTDTGSFQYPATRPDTFRIAADLLDRGISLGDISRKIYESEPARRLLLLREVLQSVRFDSKDRLGYFWIDRGSYTRSGAQPEDSEGMIDHVRAVKSVQVAVMFEELLEEGKVRISLRSKDPRINVHGVACQFGGGGHAAAAGARLSGSKSEVEAKVLEAIRKILPT